MCRARLSEIANEALLSPRMFSEHRGGKLKRRNFYLWATALAFGCLVWAMLFLIVSASKGLVSGGIGFLDLIALGGLLFIPTGVIAGIVGTIVQKARISMMTWTGLVVVVGMGSALSVLFMHPSQVNDLIKLIDDRRSGNGSSQSFVAG